ncbi:MAG: sterol desaturase family protein [Bacteroidia bacterium]|nr:sterol desaturase family protein [Bacteroidia bacterium]
MTLQFTDQFIYNSILLMLRYFILCGLFFAVFYVLFKNRLFKHKLQNKFPFRSEYIRDILYSLSSSIIFGLVFSLTITVFLPYTKLYDNIDTYGQWYFWLSFILMALLHDTYFYWTHRLIHTRRLFKIIHRVHHQSTNPSPWTSYAFHPLEAFLQALIIPVMVLLFPIQKVALIFYFLFQFLHNIYGHLGYELLPLFFTNSRVGRFLNTSVIHNKHHKNVKGNYGLLFTFWDKLMMTEIK